MKITNKIINFYRRVFWLPEKYAIHLGVKIGSNCEIYNCKWGSEPYLIEIGNHVQITDNVKFFTHGGGWVLRDKYPKFDIFGKIKIGNNVYIGNNSLIMPGVEIGNDVIIGAGSVVTKSIISNSIVVGNPARVIGTINDFENKYKKYNLNTSGLDFISKRNIILNTSNDKFIKK